MNIVFPIAGRGTRFEGYSNYPKPLIYINNKSMIQHSVESCGLDGQYIFIIRPEHREFGVVEHLRSIKPDCKIKMAIEPQSGQASAILFAKDLIDNDQYLIMSDCDRSAGWDHQIDYNLDGFIMVREMQGKQWSYTKIDENEHIIETAEKKEISHLANIGLFGFKKGRKYIEYYNKMVEKNLRVNNEFYITPVYNQGIEAGQKYGIIRSKWFYDFGTPEALEISKGRL